MSEDLLKQYNEMRNFSKTREPKGEIPKKKNRQPIFVVQKHAATRLHWDLRLELDGVLKSWAVTNEPVPDPSVKRLAVRTEDHPLAYAGFEGDIPKGEYGGGHMDIWDKGTWEAVGDPHEGLGKGKLGFNLSGSKLQGHWTLVRMRGGGKRENWLLIKGKDDAAVIVPMSKENKEGKISKAVAPLTRERAKIAFDPVLALRVDEAPQGAEWLHEIKYDGYRALLHIENGKATIITRNGLDWSARFPEIVKAAEKLKVNTASIDGEIVVFKENGISDFSLLQQTLSGDTDLQMTFIAFDLLQINNKDLGKTPLIRRKEELQKIIKTKSTLTYSDHVIGDGKKFFKEAQKLKVEGIISKNINSYYHAGRNGDWLKIKISQVQEFVIGGILRRSDNAARIGAVHLGYFKGKEFIYVGKSGTGFPEKISDDLLGKAKALNIEKSPFTSRIKPKEKDAEWLEPKLVCMIEYTELTKDGLIRHGVFKGLREDKPAPEVHNEEISPVTTVTKEKSTMIALDSKAEYAGITITHPERIVFHENNYTKQDVAAYYDRVADLILPYLKNRPVSVIRCPDGLSKKCFFQRHVSGAAARNLTQLDIKDTESGDPYFSIDDKKALLSLVQFGVIEFHPWGSKAPDFERPNRIIFDLDPDPKIDFPSIKAAALLIRDRLEEIGLRSFLKTTGGKGLHIVAPIQSLYGWDTVKQFTREFVEKLEADFPKAFVTHALKEKRKGKIFLDYLRNDETATAVAPFSLRARENAPMSVPLSWDELDKLPKPDEYNLSNIDKKIGQKFDDPWKDLTSIQQKLPKDIKPLPAKK